MSYKIFDSIPLSDAPPPNQIESIEIVEKNIFIGTIDGQVVHFMLAINQISINTQQARQSVSAVPSLHSSSYSASLAKTESKYLGSKKPVTRLRYSIVLRQLLALCDSTLCLLDVYKFDFVSSGAKVKNVTCFAVNESPAANNPFSIELCVGMKKKSVQLFILTEDRLTLVKEVALPETSFQALYDGPFICLALMERYVRINCSNDAVDELFAYSGNVHTPQVRRVDKDECVVCGPDNLAVFLLLSSMVPSTHAPIALQTLTLNDLAVFRARHLVALTESALNFHSVLDQTLKQTIPMTGGVFIASDNKDKMIVHTRRGPLLLLPVPLDKQVASLIQKRELNEALELALSSQSSAENREQYFKVLRAVQQRVGFAKLCSQEFDEAKRLLFEGQLDIRELIALYPGLAPPATLTPVAPQPPAPQPPMPAPVETAGSAGQPQQQLQQPTRVPSAPKSSSETQLLTPNLPLHSIASVELLCHQHVFNLNPPPAGREAEEEARNAFLRSYKQFLLQTLLDYRLAAFRRRRELHRKSARSSLGPELAAPPTAASDQAEKELSELVERLFAALPAVDTAIVKLYAQLDAAGLENFLSSYATLTVGEASRIQCDREDCLKWLESERRFHARALLLVFLSNDIAAAADTWHKLLVGELVDSAFQGVSYFSAFLGKLTDIPLIFKFVGSVLERDQLLGVKVFCRAGFSGYESSSTAASKTKSASPQLRFRASHFAAGDPLFNAATLSTTQKPLVLPELVIERLQRFPLALRTYLEFLVYEEKIEREPLHTQLALLYCERALAAHRDLHALQSSANKPPAEGAASGREKQLEEATRELNLAREKLSDLLQWSDHFLVQRILARIQDVPFFSEQAILYSKLGEHEKALRILVHQLGDYKRAEQYCADMAVKLAAQQSSSAVGGGSERPGAGLALPSVAHLRKQHFFTLLTIYLDPTYEHKAALVRPTIELLNNHQADFEPAQVLGTLPEDWNASLLGNYLLSSSHYLQTHASSLHVGVALVRGIELAQRVRLARFQRQHFILSEDRECDVCGRTFDQQSAPIVRTPAGEIMHYFCANATSRAPPLKHS